MGALADGEAEGRPAFRGGGRRHKGYARGDSRHRQLIGQDEAPRARLDGTQAQSLDRALRQPLQPLERGLHLGAQPLELHAQPRHHVAMPPPVLRLP